MSVTSGGSADIVPPKSEGLRISSHLAKILKYRGVSDFS